MSTSCYLVAFDKCIFQNLVPRVSSRARPNSQLVGFGVLLRECVNGPVFEVNARLCDQGITWFIEFGFANASPPDWPEESNSIVLCAVPLQVACGSALCALFTFGGGDVSRGRVIFAALGFCQVSASWNAASVQLGRLIVEPRRASHCAGKPVPRTITHVHIF